MAAIWNKRTALHETPSDSSPKDPLPIQANWVAVETMDGASGFIKSVNVHSAYDEYAVVKK